MTDHAIDQVIDHRGELVRNLCSEGLCLAIMDNDKTFKVEAILKFSTERHLFLHIYERELELLVDRNDFEVIQALASALVQLRSTH